MKYVDAVSGLDWLDNAKMQVAKGTKWGITPAMIEEQDMAYLLYLLEGLEIDSFISEKWDKEHERQAKSKGRGF